MKEFEDDAGALLSAKLALNGVPESLPICSGDSQSGDAQRLIVTKSN